MVRPAPHFLLGMEEVRRKGGVITNCWKETAILLEDSAQRKQPIQIKRKINWPFTREDT